MQDFGKSQMHRNSSELFWARIQNKITYPLIVYLCLFVSWVWVCIIVPKNLKALRTRNSSFSVPYKALD